jgi:aspartate aminotransferase, cytoplasmic
MKDSLTGIKERACKKLREEGHIYLTNDGRIAMGGLNSHNIRYFAKKLDEVVRANL